MRPVAVRPLLFLPSEEDMIEWMKRITEAASIGSANPMAAGREGQWDAERLGLGPGLVMQDPEIAEDFYYIPSEYHVVVRRKFNEQSATYVNEHSLEHSIEDRKGRAYSVYTMQMEWDQPRETQLLLAQSRLKTLQHAPVRLMGIPGLRKVEVGRARGKATVTYSLGSDSGASQSNFNVEYAVPMKLEPSAAAIPLTSSSGLELPSVNLYWDRFAAPTQARVVVKDVPKSLLVALAEHL